jgi:hypothetical protein
LIKNPFIVLNLKILRWFIQKIGSDAKFIE